jgi:hypothetical protein
MGRFSQFLDYWSRWPKLSRICKFMMMQFLFWMLWFFLMAFIAGTVQVHDSIVVGAFFARTGSVIYFLPTLIETFARDSNEVTRSHTIFRQRRKRLRKHREPWYGRRKRARWRAYVDTKKAEREAWPWDGRPEDWYSDTYRDDYYKRLHLIGYQKTYEYYCQLIENFDLIVKGEKSVFDVGPTILHKRLSFGLLNTEEPLCEKEDDLWTDCIQMQSVYLADERNSIPLVFDTGATIGVTPFASDFESWETTSHHLRLHGITSETEVRGVGIAKWEIRDDKGMKHVLRHRAYYVPSAKIRLLSPQVFIRQPENKGGKGMFAVSEDGAVFIFPHTKGKGRLTFTFECCNRLPTARIITGWKQREHQRESGSAYLNINSVLDNQNVNLTDAQKEILRWHFRLGHFNLSWIQQLTRVREGEEAILPTSVKGASSCQLPLCAACQFGKAHRRAEDAIHHEKKPEREGVLKAGHLKPGEVVSTDQYVSKLRGRLYHTRGQEKDHERFSGGTIFVDHATGFTYIYHQVSLDAPETLRGKHAFEREARSCGVEIKSYRGDNGVYRTREFMKDLLIRGQAIKFSGVGAHHQNGVAERAIRTITESARTMILHAAIHWPDSVTLDLWPMAMDYAVYLWNRMPRQDSGLAPIELFCGVKMDLKILRTARVWGCPVYVLDPMIQDGKKLPKWKPKSRRGQFLGMSRRHASTIGLIRNVRTGSISPQFHVVYDEWFTTLPSRGVLDDHQVPDEWIDLLTYSRERITPLDNMDEANRPPPLSEEWLDQEELEERRRLEQQRGIRRNQILDNHLDPVNDDQEDEDLPDLVEANNDSDDEGEAVEDQPVRRSNRVHVQNRRYFGNEWVNFVKEFEKDFGVLSDEEAFIASLPLVFSADDEMRVQLPTESIESIVHRSMLAEDIDDDDILLNLHPLAFAARANSDDTPNFHQAMNGPDAEGFYKAMEQEMEQLESLTPWDIVSRKEADERGIKVLPSTWAFKRKRYPNGSVRKLKARFCIRGDRQEEGIDYFETYAPVVSWSTVRLLLVLSVTLGLATKQVDYTLAFVQAGINEEVYVEMPKLFEKSGCVYKLKRNIYGLRQAPVNWFNRLKTGLETRGFVQSKKDPCLFISKDVICLCYVDDCLFFAKDETLITQMIENLQTEFNLNIEDDVAGFLGILLEKQPDGSIELKQTGLIDRIIKVMGLEDSLVKPTPALPEPLGKEEKGAKACEKWSYASVVGMMMYLSSNSRPDIAFAVHQAARFTHNPRHSHEQALKRVARYLKGTRTRGMIIRPSRNLRLDLYADADFAGLWNAEDPHDPHCVRSRTGYVLTLGDVPVLWGSKLQSEISLSTMEAEYIACSTAMRELLPIRELMTSLAGHLGIERDEVSTVSCVWEDNNGALTLANATYPSMTPRSKHFAIKYHWFREHLIPGQIEMFRIDTNKQKADIFTKGLKKNEYEAKRFMLVGW